MLRKMEKPGSKKGLQRPVKITERIRNSAWAPSREYKAVRAGDAGVVKLPKAVGGGK